MTAWASETRSCGLGCLDETVSSSQYNSGMKLSWETHLRLNSVPDKPESSRDLLDALKKHSELTSEVWKLPICHNGSKRTQTNQDQAKKLSISQFYETNRN